MITHLQELLHNYSRSESIDQQAQVEVEIWENYGTERTVLIWDMSGFSLLTRRHGIVHYLSMVRRMQELSRPIIERNGGELVKFEADNGFAVFPNPKGGIEAALDLNKAFDEENTSFPAEFDIRISCGLDHGQILLFQGEDFFGDPVNTASKLGEDIASAGEILVSQNAIAALPKGLEFEGKQLCFSISGLELQAVSIVSTR